MFRYVYVPNWGSVYYNAKLVNRKEFRSLWDFVDLKWKGKVEAFDPQAGGPANAAMRLFYHHAELGPSFIKKLFGDMDMTLFRDRRQGVDWLAVGKFALCFFCDTNEVARARRNGLPVAKFGPMKEGGALTSRQGILGIMADAPHPNAAKVFVNWYLSREGQSTLLRATARSGAPDSLRNDITKDDVLQEDRRIEGVPYLELDVPGLMEMGPILKFVRGAVAQSGKN
jgi:iron(III) transport system substrate-binding protein